MVVLPWAKSPAAQKARCVPYTVDNDMAGENEKGTHNAVPTCKPKSAR
jgi:hypothetical protein